MGLAQLGTKFLASQLTPQLEHDADHDDAGDHDDEAGHDDAEHDHGAIPFEFVSLKEQIPHLCETAPTSADADADADYVLMLEESNHLCWETACCLFQFCSISHLLWPQPVQSGKRFRIGNTHFEIRLQEPGPDQSLCLQKKRCRNKNSYAQFSLLSL